MTFKCAIENEKACKHVIRCSSGVGVLRMVGLSGNQCFRHWDKVVEYRVLI